MPTGRAPFVPPEKSGWDRLPLSLYGPGGAYIFKFILDKKGESMPTTWIVSADAGRARIFAESDPKQPYVEVENMVSATARLRVSDINTDRLGPTSAGQSIHNTGGATPNKQYQPAQTPQQHATDLFAKDVAEFLLKAHQEGRYQQLVLAASPEFLGVLRTKLNPQIQQLVKTEVNKDYTHSSAQQLREQLQAHQAKSE